jgi:hemerythrin superfamily protein
MVHQLQVQQMMNKSDKKSLYNLLLFLHHRWLEEQHSEDFGDYQRYVKNVLNKYAPKRTKFIEFKHSPIELTIRLNKCEHDHVFITDGKKVNCYGNELIKNENH